MTLVLTSPLAIAFTCFSMFVYTRTGFHFVLIGGNLKAQSTGSYRGIGGEIQIPVMWLQVLLIVSFLFPPHCQSVPISKYHAQKSEDTFSSSIRNVYSWFLREETQGICLEEYLLKQGRESTTNSTVTRPMLQFIYKEELGGKSSQQSEN